MLADTAKQGVDQLIVNGDLVNRGPANVAVMERLIKPDIVVTLGNHDDLMRKWIDRSPDIPGQWFDDPFWQAMAWTARQLAEAGWIDALRTLPMTHRVAVNGAPSLLISHGSPRHYREGYGKYLSDEAISEIVQDFPADILIGSHTHYPLKRRWGRHQVLNTGAVGTPFNHDPRAQYLLMTLKQDGWQAEFRALDYDREAALQAFEALGYIPAGGLSAYIFHEELRCARALHVPFWMWTEEQDKARDWASWELFRQSFPDKFLEPSRDLT